MTESATRPPLRRRQQQRSIDTRLKIIKAALNQFAMLGFEGASTRGIALAAEVPHSLVIHHYKSKTELWHETVMQVVAWYSERIFDEDPALSERPAIEKIRAFFADYIRFSAEYPDFFRMITQENMLKSDRVRWLVEHHTGKVAERLSEVIVEAQANGELIAGDPVRLVYTFLGAATGPYRSAEEIELITGRSPFDPDEIEKHIAVCLNLFLRTPHA